MPTPGTSNNRQFNHAPYPKDAAVRERTARKNSLRQPSTAVAAVLVLALATSAITRYISGTGFDWFIEIPPALIPWMVFPLLGPLLRSGSHIQVDLLPNRLSGTRLLVPQRCSSI